MDSSLCLVFISFPCSQPLKVCVGCGRQQQIVSSVESQDLVTSRTRHGLTDQGRTFVLCLSLCFSDKFHIILVLTSLRQIKTKASSALTWTPPYQHYEPKPRAKSLQVVQNPYVLAQLNSMDSWLLEGLVVPAPSESRTMS